MSNSSAIPFDYKNYSFSPGAHKNKGVIWIKFSFNKQLVATLRSSVKARWSSTVKCWYVFDRDAYRLLFHLPEQVIGKGAILKIHPTNKSVFCQYIELLQLKGYSPNTIRTYTLEFAQFLYVIKAYSAEKLTVDQLRSYCLYCINKCHISENQMHSRLNALKFYFEQVLHREKFFIEIPRPKKPYLLPKVLSSQDVTKLFLW